MQINSDRKKIIILNQVLYNYYSIYLQTSKNYIKSSIDFSSKHNLITSTYTLRFNFQLQKTDFITLKIDVSFYEIFRIVIARFSI